MSDLLWMSAWRNHCPLARYSPFHNTEVAARFALPDAGFN
jgi:hypothetical protein